MATLRQTDRSRVRRKAERGTYDRELVDAILDEALLCHVGFAVDGRAFVFPTAFARLGDVLYLHGAAGNFALKTLAGGADVCVTVTLLDGLVLARSGFNHSVNFRCVMALGTAHLVTDPEEASQALDAFIEHLYPGRAAELRPMTPKEKKATTVLWMDLTEASAKIRDDVNHDDPGDESWPTWAGVIPVRQVRGAPEPDPFVAAAATAPEPRLP